MFIVERYLPAARQAELAAAVDHDRRAAERMTAAGVPARHLATIYVPSDESCFSLFDAPSADALRQAQERAGIGFERIVEAVQLPPPNPRNREPLPHARITRHTPSSPAKRGGGHDD
jgi:hypothetical protein